MEKNEMKWVKPLLPLLQTGLKIFATRQLLRTTSESAKDFALRSSVIAFGTVTFLIFAATAIIMAFIDLGHQFEAHDGVRFSGMMLSALYLFSLAVFFQIACFLAAKILSSRERQKKIAEQSYVDPYTPLILFGEEFLKQLAVTLNEKPKSE
jgi:hypothetical protein